MYQYPGTNDFQVYQVPTTTTQGEVRLGGGYSAQNAQVREEVRNYIESYLAAIEHRHKLQLYHHSIREPPCDVLSHPVAKKVFYFIDGQGVADKLLTTREVQHAKRHLDDLLQ